ncbi:hypothetical protein BH09DEP1_BH09DEP1_8220 [soil metagenome]
MKIPLFLLITFFFTVTSQCMDRPYHPYNPDEMKGMLHLMMMAQAAEGHQEDTLVALAMATDDHDEAYKIYSQLAKKDSKEKWHEHALLGKGTALSKGIGVKKDRTAALKCFQECYTQHKSGIALLALGDHYEEESQLPDNYRLAAISIKKDLRQAIQWLDIVWLD